jgi:hypothetical protein
MGTPPGRWLRALPGRADHGPGGPLRRGAVLAVQLAGPGCLPPGAAPAALRRRSWARRCPCSRRVRQDSRGAQGRLPALPVDADQIFPGWKEKRGYTSESSALTASSSWRRGLRPLRSWAPLPAARRAP